MASKKMTSDRGNGKGVRDSAITITEVNVNMKERSIHVVCSIVDMVDYDHQHEVVFIEGADFDSIMTRAGASAPLFQVVSDAVWNHINTKDKAQVVLGRKPAVDEIVPDIVTLS